MTEEDSQDEKKVSYWEVFFDDIFLLFFLSVAITFISYTVWGLMELGSVGLSPLIKP
jgi:low temperature requirement protein LtrA